MRCVLKSPDPAAEPPPDAAADLAERTARNLRALAGGPVSRLPELLDAMTAVGTDHDLRRALARIAETAASLTGACHAAVGIRSAYGDGAGGLITHGEPPDRAGRPSPATSLEVPITFHGEVFGSLALTGKRGPGAHGAPDGRPFTEEDLHLVRVLATEAGIAMGNARMHAAARQRTRWIDGAASVTTALLAGPETRSTTEDALTVVAEKGRELAEAATGAVLLPHPEGGMEVVAISTELTEAVRAEAYRGRIPPESPVLHQIHAGLAVFADDFATDPRSVSPLSRHYGPTMLLPLRSNGRVLGALALCRLSGGRRFSPSERTLGTQFAAQAALALVLADRHRDRERLAVYEDRDRIARDLGHPAAVRHRHAAGERPAQGRAAGGAGAPGPGGRRAGRDDPGHQDGDHRAAAGAVAGAAGAAHPGAAGGRRGGRGARRAAGRAVRRPGRRARRRRDRPRAAVRAARGFGDGPSRPCRGRRGRHRRPRRPPRRPADGQPHGLTRRPLRLGAPP
ncbi:GAF domain-containing protein [Streptomyces lydicus]|uniref:GAF domain-containing protein n=1 Tax=Streptomyces lydicus TaxID=47763 RepID=UPI00378D087D